MRTVKKLGKNQLDLLALLARPAGVTVGRTSHNNLCLLLTHTELGERLDDRTAWSVFSRLRQMGLARLDAHMGEARITDRGRWALAEQGDA